MELPKQYISYSQIKLYQACPKKYYYTYVRNIPVPLNDKIYLGIVFHAAVEYYLNEKIAGRLPVSERVLDYFTDHFDSGVQKFDINWDLKPQETRRRGIAFVRYFMKDVAYTLNPIMVEKELLAQVPELDVPLKGVIDMVEADFSITDFKTTTAKWSKSRIKNSYLQVIIYRYLFEKNFGDVASRLKFKIFYAKNASNIRHQEVEIKPTDVDFDYNKMFEIIKHVVDGITSSVFHRNDSYVCSYCEFRKLCRSENDTLQKNDPANGEKMEPDSD